MEKLLEQYEVTDINNTKKIQNLYDKIESNVRILEAMSITWERYGSFLVSVIMSKIPNEMQIVISRQLDKKS